MKTQVDKFGRIFIPKKIQEMFLQRYGNVLVYCGEATGDLASAINNLREDRLENLF